MLLGWSFCELSRIVRHTETESKMPWLKQKVGSGVSWEQSLFQMITESWRRIVMMLTHARACRTGSAVSLPVESFRKMPFSLNLESGSIHVSRLCYQSLFVGLCSSFHLCSTSWASSYTSSNVVINPKPHLRFKRGTGMCPLIPFQNLRLRTGTPSPIL